MFFNTNEIENLSIAGVDISSKEDIDIFLKFLTKSPKLKVINLASCNIGELERSKFKELL